MRSPLWLLPIAGLLTACPSSDSAASREDAGRDAGALHLGDAASAEQAGTLTTLQIGEFTFQLRVAGPEHGEPVILLHGFPETSLEWQAQIPSLAAAGFRVVAPDQRGYSLGARPETVADYQMPLLVRDVLSIADALGFDRFHLVGHDWGASVTWVAAYIAPQRLLSIAPISVPHLDAFGLALNDPGSCQPAASGYIAGLVADGSEARLLRDDSAELRKLYEGLPQPRVDAYLDHFRTEGALRGPLNWYRANLAPGTASPAIGKTRVPTLYIWSDRDPALCRDGAERTAAFVDAPYQFEILQGVGHWVPELAAERVNALLLAHLRKYAAK
jgi:pimeloyl-ACP methyl ester carboxylesterase